MCRFSEIRSLFATIETNSDHVDKSLYSKKGIKLTYKGLVKRAKLQLGTYQSAVAFVVPYYGYKFSADVQFVRHFLVFEIQGDGCA